MSDTTDNSNGEGEIDWSKFVPQKKVEQTSTGSIDAQLATPATIANVAPPTDLSSNLPDKPKMMQYLTNYKAAKISQDEYVGQLKNYARAQTEIMRDQLEKTVSAHAALTESSVRGVHEKIRAWAQEITAVTDLSMQNTVSRSIEKASEIANSSLQNIARMKNPHPLIQQKAIESIISTMEKTIENIQAGGAEFQDNKMVWRK